jgi:hypothetical protein
VKLRFVILFLLALSLMLAAIPAMAQDVYDNGPVNGEVGAWPINVPYAVSDSFYLSSSSMLVQMNFWAWLTPGDTITSVVVQFGSNGPLSFNLDTLTVPLTQSNCFLNGVGTGFMVCQESGSFTGPALGAGEYWVTLSQAQSGSPVYWDQNSGVGCISSGCPSTASVLVTTVATIPSEAFTMGGVAFSKGSAR